LRREARFWLPRKTLKSAHTMPKEASNTQRVLCIADLHVIDAMQAKPRLNCLFLSDLTVGESRTSFCFHHPMSIIPCPNMIPLYGDFAERLVALQCPRANGLRSIAVKARFENQGLAKHKRVLQSQIIF
jgi:hypothetical protein